jgi:hypothetical protein
VLGCTTDAGQITIINGWNFYAGSDATQIGSTQYDFETVVEHELGHALGLGHSTDSTSVMYATLNTGTVNRSLTVADLNVADSDTTGACGLRALVDVGQISNLSYVTGFLASDEKPEGVPGRNRVDMTRDFFFALAAMPADGFGATGAATRAERGVGVIGDRRQTQIDAVFASLNDRPIFASPSQLESDDPQFDVPLFPEPDAPATAGSIAADWVC